MRYKEIVLRKERSYVSGGYRKAVMVVKDVPIGFFWGGGGGGIDIE